MNKTKIYALLSLLIGAEYASADSVTNANQAFINPNSYYENPDGNKPSGMIPNILLKVRLLIISLLENYSATVSWNVFTAATSNYSGIMQSKTSAQSNMTLWLWRIIIWANWADWWLLIWWTSTVDNPFFFNSQLNGWRQDQAPFMTTKQLTQLNELYVEYQYEVTVCKLMQAGFRLIIAHGYHQPLL